MVVATLLVGTGALHGGGWRGFVVLAVYVVQKALLTWLASVSFGQLLARVAVVRVEGGPIGAVAAIARAFVVGLVGPGVACVPTGPTMTARAMARHAPIGPPS